MLRTSLSDSHCAEFQPLRRTDLPAVSCDRLEMVLLSDAGWSPLEIAEQLGRHSHTVRAAIKGFAAQGPVEFHPEAPDPDHDRRATGIGKLSELHGLDWTWTARQLAYVHGPDVGIDH